MVGRVARFAFLEKFFGKTNKKKAITARKDGLEFRTASGFKPLESAALASSDDPKKIRIFKAPCQLGERGWNTGNGSWKGSWN